MRAVLERDVYRDVVDSGVRARTWPWASADATGGAEGSPAWKSVNLPEHLLLSGTRVLREARIQAIWRSRKSSTWRKSNLLCQATFTNVGITCRCIGRAK